MKFRELLQKIFKTKPTPTPAIKETPKPETPKPTPIIEEKPKPTPKTKPDKPEKEPLKVLDIFSGDNLVYTALKKRYPSRTIHYTSVDQCRLQQPGTEVLYDDAFTRIIKDGKHTLEHTRTKLDSDARHFHAQLLTIANNEKYDEIHMHMPELDVNPWFPLITLQLMLKTKGKIYITTDATAIKIPGPSLDYAGPTEKREFNRNLERLKEYAKASQLDLKFYASRTFNIREKDIKPGPWITHPQFKSPTRQEKKINQELRRHSYNHKHVAHVFILQKTEEKSQ